MQFKKVVRADEIALATLSKTELQWLQAAAAIFIDLAIQVVLATDGVSSFEALITGILDLSSASIAANENNREDLSDKWGVAININTVLILATF
jgi:hypothetical protein